jgi:hypothetical protein
MRDQRISSYLTTWNCVQAGQPFAATIAACLQFSCEVVVADGGSSDGTWERLLALARSDHRLRLQRYTIDRSRPYWALQSEIHLLASARVACRGAFCFEARSDEVLRDGDAPRLLALLPRLGVEAPLLALPVLEHWQHEAAVRRDVVPAAPRLSLNLPTITHGLPAGCEAVDAQGHPYALPFQRLSETYIDRRTREPISVTSLYPLELEELREHVACPDPYLARFTALLAELPAIRRLTWCDVRREVRRLRDHWAPLEESLYRLPSPPSALPFADKPWPAVSDDELETIAQLLTSEGPGAWTGFSGEAIFELPRVHSSGTAQVQVPVPAGR